ncbi:MAG: Gfo/Idh/MocA family oxidoreductase [Planctomycetes bacterium]|nr:Gfo/Idh/MocA family oxidoreductase [Planctomycetota bacterium]
MRIAFAGFRHGHINDLYAVAARRDDVEIVAACESHEPTREKVIRGKAVNLTHRDYTEMLAEVDCDAVAVGDYYARRGKVILAALTAGRHVISDKPICTDSGQLRDIASLAAEGNLCVGCMLNLRDEGVFRTMRRLIGEGAIGQVHTVTFLGQHPLSYASRPAWYFEEGRQGGTINDIAIHAIDLVGWMTGRTFTEAVAARVWNARLKEAPFFQDGAQMMLRMDNDGGVLGDVSYFAPEEGGYSMPQYWRFTCHGPAGVLEAALKQENVFLGGRSATPEQIEPDPGVEGGYFDSFLGDIAGTSAAGDLDTAAVIEASRITLAIQEAADGGRLNVPLES